MTINVDTLLAGFRPPIPIYFPSQPAEGTATWLSLWKVAGSKAAGASPPAFGAGSGYIPTRATAGSLGQANPGGSNNLYLTGASISGTTGGGIIVYDRLWACSGFSTVSVSAQNVVTPGTLTAGRLRDEATDFSDVEAWLEVYTVPGATGATWTVVALDGAGVSRSYTYAHPANAETAGQMMPLTQPTNAAAGIQQVTSFTASISSGTAGDVGVTLLRRLAFFPIPIANIPAVFNAMDIGMPEIKTDACLGYLNQCITTGTGVFVGQLGMSEIAP